MQLAVEKAGSGWPLPGGASARSPPLALRAASGRPVDASRTTVFPPQGNYRSGPSCPGMSAWKP
jgi:hypothetical protein